MKITTNVAKYSGQVQLIAELVEAHIGDKVKPTTSLDKDLTLTEIIFGWVNWCHKVPSEERISGKRIVTSKGRCTLTYNNLNGSVKLQFRK